MNGLRKAVFLLFLTCFGGVTSLRDVKLLVEPAVVRENGTAALICSRDMQGAPLYSVKWYRGNHEFYRYTPLENPSTRVFGLRGIYVDMNNSNGTQVQLRKLDLSLAGVFKCEVTADSSFSTQIATKFIDIVALPDSPPVLKAEKDRYSVGELLRANCTSSPAKPPANLTIYINDEPLSSSETSLQSFENGLFWSSVAVELVVTPKLFHSGRLRVSCNSTLYDVYNESATLDFFTPETDPRPERITLNAATKCFTSWILLFLLILLPMVVLGQEYEQFSANLFKEAYEDFNNENFEDIQYYEENPKKAFMSLMGH